MGLRAGMGRRSEGPVRLTISGFPFESHTQIHGLWSTRASTDNVKESLHTLGVSVLRHDEFISPIGQRLTVGRVTKPGQNFIDIRKVGIQPHVPVITGAESR